MDKFELYAVGHYFSEWPEQLSFVEFMSVLRSDDDEEHWHWWASQQYENTLGEDLAFLVEDMVHSLRETFQ